MSNNYGNEHMPSWDEGRDDHYTNASFYNRNLASSSSFDPFQVDVNDIEQEQRQNQTEEIFKAELMTIKVDDAQKSSDGSFVSYRVFTMTCLEIYSPDKRPVRRRFRDFLWLHNALTIEFPACIIPPLPEKHRMKYVKGDRFNSTFIEQRRLGLQWFMDRIARHAFLQSSQYTRLFLESTDFKSDKNIQTKTASTSSSFGFFKSLTKVKKPDEKFIEIKENVDKFQDNLNIVEKLYSRIGKRQQELEQNYNLFASSIRGLSALETNVDQPLRQFAEATESYVEALKEMRSQEDLLFLNDIHELLNYCNATRQQLIERDEKQVNFEHLSHTLQSIILERERVLYPSRHTGGAGGGSNISEFMADKMNEGRKTKNERVFRLECKIAELQDCVAKANDENISYSSQMIKEFDIFQKAKETELKQGLAAYADCHIDFYKKSISIWENILPVLDQIQLEDS